MDGPGELPIGDRYFGFLSFKRSWNDGPERGRGEFLDVKASPRDTDSPDGSSQLTLLIPW